MGHTDLPLNSRGQRQADCLGQKLKSLSFSRCYTSDLARARQTTRAILSGDGETPLLVAPALREISFGKWEGLTYAEVCRNYPEEAKARAKSNGLIAPVEGESLSDLQKRLLGWLHPVINEDPQGNILVVTHGGVLRLLLCLVLDVPITKHRKFNAAAGSLAIVEMHDGEGILEVGVNP